jgi:hypothetical protein
LLWAPEGELLGDASMLTTPHDGRTDAGTLLDLQELWAEPWNDLLTSVDALESDTPSEASASTSMPRVSSDPRLITLSYASSARRVTTKHRIQLLKTEVERLQLDLDAMRQQTRQAGSRACAPASTVGGMWQAMAARQQQRRQQAETENKRLRSLEHAQRRHLQSVRRLLGRRPHRDVSIGSGVLGCYDMLTHPCTLALLVTASGRRDQQTECAKCEDNPFHQRLALRHAAGQARPAVRARGPTVGGLSHERTAVSRSPLPHRRPNRPRRDAVRVHQPRGHPIRAQGGRASLVEIPRQPPAPKPNREAYPGSFGAVTFASYQLTRLTRSLCRCSS